LTAVRLYVIPGSHPARAAELMLRHKGIEYKRTDLPPVLSRFVVQRVLRFPGDRVPAMKVDGRKVQGSQDVSRELDALRPEPPLFPADADQRARVEEAERWGDVYFQEIPRKISWWALKRHKSDQASFLRGYRLGLPTGMLVATSPPLIRMAMRLNDSTDEVVQEQIAAIPAALDKVDAWIAEGVIGGAQPNAADFQLATSLRLLMAFADIEPAIEGRPAGELALRIAPDSPGRIGPAFPNEWLAPLQAGVTGSLKGTSA
jgi:glutathione S-transferase